MISVACRALEGKLIASCQANEGDPFREPTLIAKFAQAAVLGGAAGIRAEGAENIRAIRKAVSVPIVGIRKVRQDDGRILITPTFESARELVDAGSDVIALDCTTRGRHFGAFERLRRIRAELHVPVAADIATLEEAVMAVEAGADFVLSTLRGYTAETSCVRKFEAEFIQALVERLPVPVIAEGRIHRPRQARDAIAAGAFAVIVGTAISRPRDITSWFAKAVEDEFATRTQCAIGIDLGGTNTKFGIVSRTGGMRLKGELPTPQNAGRAALLEHLKYTAMQAASKAEAEGLAVSRLGIATAGWVDTRTGTVAYATENLPGWTGTPIAREIGAELHLPVAVENDANALALAEKYFGAGKPFRHFICLTLGTGVGGGCYIDGALNRGAHFFANAAGHITLYPGGLPCSCGKRGCLEAYANSAALLAYAGNRFSSGRELIHAANHDGDANAVSAVRTLAGHLAQGCASMIQLLDPEAIIVSGGLAQENPLLFQGLEESLADLVSTWRERRVAVLPSPLGYHGGVLGAAAVAFEQA